MEKGNRSERGEEREGRIAGRQYLIGNRLGPAGAAKDNEWRGIAVAMDWRSPYDAPVLARGRLCPTHSFHHFRLSPVRPAGPLLG